MQTTQKNNPLRYIWLWLALLGFIIYLPAISAPFQLDDFNRIVHNGAIRDLGKIGQLWLYEPARFITNFTLALNYRFWGLEVASYRLINIAVHILNSWLVYLLVTRLFQLCDVKGSVSERRQAAVAAISAFIFLCHPIQTQGVTYIIQRAVSLGSCFYFITLLHFLKYKTDKSLRSRLIALAACICALSTKENTITLPVMLLAMNWLLLKTPFRKAVKETLPFLLLLGLIPVYYRYNQVSFTSVYTTNDYFITQIRVWLTYLRLLTLPFKQQLEYDFPVYDSLLNIQVITSITVLAVLSFLFWLKRKQNPLLFSGFVFFVLSLSPDSSFAALNDLIFEHRLYLPMFGFCIIISIIFIQLLPERLLRITAAAWILMLCLLTFQRNLLWQNPEKLLLDNLKHAPNHARLNLNLGHLKLSQFQYAEAEPYLLKALESEPNYARALNNLGTVYLETGRGTEAKKTFEKAARLEPLLPQPHYMLGLIELKENKFESAENAFKRALQLSPSYAFAYAGLAQCYLSQNKPQIALQTLLEGQAQAPHHGVIQLMLGQTYALMKNDKAAEAAFARAAALGFPMAAVKKSEANDLA